MYYSYMNVPIGRLLLAGDEDGLHCIGLPQQARAQLPQAHWRADDGTLHDARDQLEAYFAGARRDFALTLAPQATAFQRTVLDQLQAVPFGQTISYAELAQRLGKPGAARAVGSACARNPLPIVIPCHRVVGSQGALTGFAGGIEAKRWLLAHEAPR